MPSVCEICLRRGIYYRRPYEGVYLCRQCFKKSIEKKIKKTVSKYKMLKHDDYIGVAVSGGKDSLTLLKILDELSEKFSGVRIHGIMIDEGIEGYRTEARDLVTEMCKNLSIPLMIVTFKELFDTTMDELVNNKEIKVPCSYCGVLRRRALDKAALETGIDKLATAHNLDDEIQTYLLNLFHGDPYRISRNKPRMESIDGVFPTRIKPFCMISEKEISLYAYLNKIKFQKTLCPYSESALRNDMRKIVNYLDGKHPGIKYTLYHSIEKIQLKLKKIPINKGVCKKCGHFSSDDICNICKILKKVIPKTAMYQRYTARARYPVDRNTCVLRN